MSSSKIPDILGIDFGTSNSAVGVAIDGKPQLVNVEGSEKTLPTSVFFDSEDRTTRFGHAANRSLIQHDEGRFMRALKSVLGTPLMHEPRYLLGNQVTFVDVVASFLSHLKQCSENELQRECNYALSGRPVHFHSEDHGRDVQALKDLTQCYMAAGFKGVEFLHEPEAAAVASGTLRANEIALIVDIGGGTSDFCLFQKQKNGIDVLASSGVRIGGTDFDRRLSTEHVMPLLGRGEQIKKEMGEGALPAPDWIYQNLAAWEKIPTLYNAKDRNLARELVRLAFKKAPFKRLQTTLNDELGHDIAFAVERGKIQTNKTGAAEIDLAFLSGGPEEGLEETLGVGLTEQLMDASLRHFAERIRNCACETLAMAQCPAANVDQIIMVGGSSLMKVVETSIAEEFPAATLHFNDAFTAIVDGLAIASSHYR